MNNPTKKQKVAQVNSVFMRLGMLLCGICLLLVLVLCDSGGGGIKQASAASSYASTSLGTRLDYDKDSNMVSVYYNYTDGGWLSTPFHFTLTFYCGSRSWKYSTTDFNTSGYIKKSLSGIDFFTGGCEYTVYLTAMDEEAYETDLRDAPYYYHRNVGSFSIPGEIVPLPEPPVKEGYHFVGWYYDEAFTQPYDNAPIYADTNIYAKMEINTYTVSYDTGCDVIVPSETVDWNTAASLPAPTRTGYDFVGWYKADGTPYENEGVVEDITLTAHWEIKLFTVTFYLDGEVYTSLQVPYGSPLGNVMTQAKVANYRALDLSGVRVSLQSSITEDTQVLIHEMTGWEKYGDFVARNQWYTWVTIAVLCVLLAIAIVGIVEMVKKR